MEVTNIHAEDRIDDLNFVNSDFKNSMKDFHKKLKEVRIAQRNLWWWDNQAKEETQKLDLLFSKYDREVNIEIQSQRKEIGALMEKRQKHLVDVEQSARRLNEGQANSEAK